MPPAHRVRRHGFASWYQRELTASHAHLVLLLLAAFGLLASIEAMDRSLPLTDQAVMLLCVLASGAVAVYALRRYLFLLMHAEYVANQAVCPHCRSYARWTLLAEADAGRRWRVQCRQCEQRWEIET